MHPDADPDTPPGHDPEADAGIELLSFRLCQEEYSMEIMSVREIRSWTRPTPLPHAPPHMRGVINLRGTVLPVIDLAHRLGLPPIGGDQRNVIIVVQSGDVLAGLLVEAVSDIIVLPRASLQSPPTAAACTSEACIAALTVTEGRMLRILDLSVVVPPIAVQAA